MNKRGEVDLLVYAYRVALVILLAFLLNVQIGFFTGMSIETHDLEAALITQRILEGPDGLVQSVDGRPRPGVISFSKLLDPTVDLSFTQGEEPHWGGKISLYNSHQDIADDAPLKATLLAEGSTATKLLPLAAAGVRGPGGGMYYSSLHPVQYTLRDDHQELGWLKIELVRRT